MRPWRGAPVSTPTATSTSSGASRRSTSASSAAFSPRFVVAASALETAASSANSIVPCTVRPRMPATRAGGYGVTYEEGVGNDADLTT